MYQTNIKKTQKVSKQTGNSNSISQPGLHRTEAVEKKAYKLYCMNCLSKFPSLQKVYIQSKIPANHMAHYVTSLLNSGKSKSVSMKFVFPRKLNASFGLSKINFVQHIVRSRVYLELKLWIHQLGKIT